MFTAVRIENNDQISSVVRCASKKQLSDWCVSNGYIIVSGYNAQKILKTSGACVRLLKSDGRVGF